MFLMVMSIIFMILMVVVLYLLLGRRVFRLPWWDSHPRKDSDTALDILKKRYAKGELKIE